MSMSVGGCSQPQTYQQVQQISVDASKASGSPESMDALMKAASDSYSVPAPDGGPLSQLGDTSTNASAFSSDTLGALISAQGQSSSGSATSASHTDQPITTVASPGDIPAYSADTLDTLKSQLPALS